MEFELEMTDIETLERKKKEQEERLKGYFERISKSTKEAKDNE